MFKIQIKRIKRIIIFGAILGLIWSIFFIKKEVSGSVGDMLQGLINTIEGNDPTDKVFEGKAMVQNIYQRALKGQKRTAAETINKSIEKIQFVTTGGINIDKKDLLNILYNSNDGVSFKIDFFCKNCKISQEAINQSYSNVLKQLKITNNNATTRAQVDERVNSQFNIISDGQTLLQSFDESTIGEDTFMNGTNDDSDYDLQVDIQNIGNLMFNSFIAPIETVFYSLPTARKGSSSNQGSITNGGTTKEKQELITLLQNTLPLNTGIITNGGSQPQSNQTTLQTNKNKSVTNNQNDTKIADKALQSFVTQNNLSQKSNTQVAGIQGDSCSAGVSGGPTSSSDDQNQDTTTEQEYKNYMAAIETEVANYNNINSGDQNIPNVSDIAALSGMTPSQTNQLIEDYTNQALDTTGVENCLKSCSSLPAADKVLCQSQCLCFSLVRPKETDTRLKSMNEMVKLRFCTVPAKSMAIPKGKNIYSFDDILNRIQGYISNLINNGEMVKFQKNKEYLDNPVADLKRDKIISFQMNINMKPIFNNKSAMAKKDQEETYLKKLEEAAGKSENPGLDTNKYVIVQDTIANKIYKEYAESAEAYQQKYNKAALEEDLKKIENQKTAENNTVMAIKKSETLTIISEFLDANVNFWDQIGQELQNINNIIFSLQSKL